MIFDIFGEKIEIVLDGKNRIWKLSLDYPAIQNLVQDLEIEEAIKVLSQNVPSNGFEIWWKCILALKAAKGDKVLHFENPKRDQILCRCQGYSLSDLKETLDKEGLTQKELMVKTQIGMTCTNCRSQIDQFYQSLELTGHLILGKTYEEWKGIIAEALKGFKSYSGIDLEVKVIRKIDFPQVMIEVGHMSDEALREVQVIERSLTNYLSGKLGMPLQVSLAFLL